MSKRWSIVPALDVLDLDVMERVVASLADHPFVHGYKLGFSVGLTHGLPRAVELIRKHSDKPVIYDHQKAATDIPATGKLFASVMTAGGIDEVILFPQAGPVTLRAWIEALHERGRKVIVGGAMTHAGYLDAEGGFLLDAAPERMYGIAREAGVRAFVMPLTKPGIAQAAAEAAGVTPEMEVYSPGYGSQGGDPARFPFFQHHHVIVGRALLGAEDPAAWVSAQQALLEAIE
jgi:orotidine-5'-phosphate decarboxylase